MRVLALVLVLGGCGPVEYIGQVTRRASSEVAAAKTAGADRYAPYEYTAAVEYLHKAREEAGYADFQAAIRFGKKAEELAKKASELAKAGKQSDTPPADTAPPDVSAPDDKAGDKPPKFVPPEGNE